MNSSSTADRNVTFSLSITAAQGSWNDQFNLTIVSSPNLTYYYYSVTSESNGDLIADNDYVVDPGEVVNFNLYLKNIDILGFCYILTVCQILLTSP